MIPRTIHQTYPSRFDTGGWPAILLENLDHIRSLNPGWSHQVHNDEGISRFIQHHYGQEVLRAYNRINPCYGPARADLFRYLLLYALGGVYLDIKGGITRPLDQVLRPGDDYLISQWRNRPGDPFEEWGLHPELSHVPGGEFQQWFIIASPRHPFLKAVIRRVLANIEAYRPETHGTGHIGVLRVTGPLAYTLAITPLLPACSHRRIPSEDDLGLRYTIFGPPAAFRHRLVFGRHYTNLDEPVVLG